MKYDKIKGFIFDMDGTMFDTEKVYYKFWKVTAAERGFIITDEMIDKMRGASVENIGVLFKQVNPDFDYMEERAVRKGHIYDYLREHGIPKKEGLDELFSWLIKKGYRLALGSSSIKEQVMMYLNETDYTGKFDYICAGDMIENGKPAPDIYLHCAEKLGLKPEECIVVEDSPNGIRAGFAAGCKVFGIKDMSELTEVREMLSEEPATLTDIIKIIEQNQADK